MVSCKFSFIRSFFKLKLSTQMVLGTLFGVIVGLILRNNPEFKSFIGLDIESFKKVGMIFVNLIKMISIPLIFTAILSSVISADNMEGSGKVAFRSLVVFCIMTAICALVGEVSAIIFKPGENVNFNKELIISQNAQNATNIISKARNISGITDFIFDIVPSNLFDTFYKGDMLQIIFLAVLFGIGIIKLSEKKKLVVVKSISIINDISMSVVNMIMKIAPIGSFGIMVWLFDTQDINLIKSLGKIILLMLVNVIFIVYVVYSLIFIFILRLNPIPFFKKMIPAQLMAFLTSNTTAVVPMAMDIARNKLGVSKEKVDFVIPLAASIDKNGSAIHLTMCSVFIAQIFGLHLDLNQYAIIFAISFLCALGTAPIPGASIFLLGNVLSVIGLPVEAIGLVLGIDRVLDMLRTVVNLSGDALAAVIVDRTSNTLDKEIYNH
jgi:Na+/H+-dicarboxylate symporter